jgi:hypothetical protein
MKVRTQKELLEVMLANIGRFRSGLCSLNSELLRWGIITSDEHSIIHAYIKANRPSKFSSLGALRCRNSIFYWPEYKVKYRVKWLKQHIKKLS